MRCESTSSALLRELLIELREVRAELRALRERPRVTPGSRTYEQRATLLLALFERAADSVFSTSELAADATRPGNETLREAILRANGGSLNPRHLGKLLRALEGVNIGGLRIVRCGVDRLGVIWTVKVAEVTSALTHCPL